MPSWKKIITSGSDAILNSLNVATSITASIISGSSITGSLFGTSSWAQNAITASFITPTGTNAFVQGGNSFGTTALLGTNDNNNLELETNGSTRLFISSSGNVGIGTSNTSYTLQVAGPIYQSAAQLLIAASGSVAAEVPFIASTATGNRKLQMGIYDNGVVPVGIDMFETNNDYPSTYLNFRVNNTDLVRMTGNFVGIGTTSPTSRLQVRGSGATSATTALLVENSSATPSLVITDAGVTALGTSTPNGGIGKLEIAGEGAGQGIGIISGSGLSLRIYRENDTGIISRGTTPVMSINNSFNVGIGTTSPSQKLEVRDGFVLVSGSGASGYGYLLNRAGQDSYAIRHLDGGLTISNETDNRKEMTFLGNGNVGIGTTSPQRRLHIDASGSSNPATPLILTSVDTNNRVGIQFASSSIASGKTHSLIHRVQSPQVEWILGASAGESGLWQFQPQDNSTLALTIATPFNGGTARIYTGQSQSLFALGAGAANNHLVISSSGNVGIGTTSPFSNLVVNGNTGITINANGAVMPNLFRDSSDGGLLFRSYNTSTNLYTNNVKVTPGGNVGIGTTNPTEKLYVDGNVIVTGRITAEEFHTEFVSSSIIYKSGSTQFGDSLDDTHIFTGSINTTGSLLLKGPLYDNLGTAGTPDQILYTTSTGVEWRDNIAQSAEDLIITGKNVGVSTIEKGTPLYFTGSGTSGNIIGILPADAGNPDRMPAGGVAGEQITAGNEGDVYIYGFISGVNTSAFSSGDDVFVAVGGGYTNVKPTGSALIQKLGNVEKSDASNGSGVIQGPSWYNDLPNWEIGRVMVGRSNGQPVTSSLVYLDESNGRLGLGTSTPNYTLDISGSGNFTEDVYISGSLEFEGSTNNLYLTPSTDVRNWYLTGKNFNVSSQAASSTGIYFKDDGTRFYIVGTSADRIFQYDLSTAWDVSTAVYNSVSLLVSSQDSTPNDIFISPNGTILFMLGDTNNAVYRYNLSSAWDVSSATFVNSFSVSAEESNPNGLYFDPTGTNMYVIGTNGDDVNQYTLGTAWDLTTVSFLQTFSVASRESTPTAISFNNAGTRMYILGQTGDDITEYRLSTAWDISTATFFTTGFTGPETSPGGLYYNETYEVAYIVGSSADVVYGLAATPQLKYYGDSFVMDSQMFVGGRTEIAGTLYVNNSITATSTITTAGSLVSSNASFSTSTISLGTGTSTTTVNIGGNASLSSTNRFAYGAITSGLTKTIEIGTGGLTGSITNTTIGSGGSGGKIILAQNTEFAQNATVRTTLNVNNNANILDSAQSASGEIVVFDTFTEASNTLLNLHTPDTGSGWSRDQISTFTSPTMTVFSATNTSGPTTTVSNEGVIYRQDTVLTTPNYEVSVDLVTQDSSDDILWLFARYQDVNNFYGVSWSTTQANCRLVRRVSGTFTILATLSVAPITGATTLSIRVLDNLIVVLNGGNVVISAFDTNITDAGYAAIGGGNIGQTSTDDFDATWKFDNFMVRYYQAGVQTSNITGGLNISGNVGIGTSTPLSTLTVAGGNININSGYGIGGNNVGSFSPFIRYNTNAGIVSSSFGHETAYMLSDAGGIFGANDLSFYAGAVTQPEIMRIVGSTGFVGIGESSPSAKLEIKGSGATSATTALRVENSSATERLTILDDGTSAFNTSHLYISSSGNVGIGTTTPLAQLHITNSLLVGATSTYFGATSTNPIQLIAGAANNAIGMRADGIYMYPYGSTTTLHFGFNGNSAWRLRNQNTSSFQIYNSTPTNAVLVNISSSGNVGIGNSFTNPSARLHISGASNSGLFEIDSPAQNNIIYASGSGNVGIGTGTPTEKLHIVGSNPSSYIAGKIENTGVDGAADFDFQNDAIIWKMGVNASDLFRIRNHTTGNNILNISSSGNVGIGTGTPTQRLHISGSIALTEDIIQQNTNLDMKISGTQTGRAIKLITSANGLRLQAIGSTTSNFILSTTVASSEVQRLAILENGDVGIGTTSPTSRLQVRGSGATSATTALRVENSAATETLTILDDGTSAFNTSHLYISSSGRIGVGTATPTMGILDINGIARARSILYFGGTGAGDWKGAISGQSNGLLVNLNVLTINNSGYASPATQSFAINTSQNVAIGPHSPTARLHVSGASNDVLFEIDSPTQNNIIYASGSGNVGIGTGTPSTTLQVAGTSSLQNIIFDTNSIYDIGTSAVRARNIWSNGIVVGTTSFFNQAVIYNNARIGGEHTATALLHISGSDSAQMMRINSPSNDNILFVSGSGNVGIGTGTPTNTLQVVGGVTATSFTGSLFGTSSWAQNALTSSFITPTDTNAFVQGGNLFGTTALLGTNDNQNLQFETSGSVRMTISSSGNVGIGTITPARALEIVNSSAPQLRIRDGVGGGNLDLQSDGSGQTRITWGGNGYIAGEGSTLRIRGIAAGVLIDTNGVNKNISLAPNGVVQLFVSSSGNVGIGTTNPLFKLHVLGTGAGDSTFSEGILIENNNVTAGEAAIAFRTSATPASNYWFTGLNQSNTYDVAYGPAFSNANTILSITTNSRVGIGTISPTSRLHIKGSGATSATTALLVENSNASASLVVLDNNNVGIGTTSPTAKLHIDGDTILSGSLYTYGSNSDIDSGSLRTVLSVSTGSYRAAFFDYVLNKSTNARAGTVFSVWNGTSVEYTETSTTDIGNTSDVNLSVGLSGGDIILYASSSTNDWSMKALARLL